MRPDRDRRRRKDRAWTLPFGPYGILLSLLLVLMATGGASAIDIGRFSDRPVGPHGLPSVVHSFPSGEVLARERLRRNEAVRDRIRARHQPVTIPRASPAPADALRARAGRSALDPGRAGVFARSGPAAIGGSSATRPSLSPRRR